MTGHNELTETPFTITQDTSLTVALRMAATSQLGPFGLSFCGYSKSGFFQCVCLVHGLYYQVLQAQAYVKTKVRRDVMAADS